jgi:hypothetical protein
MRFGNRWQHGAEPTPNINKFHAVLVELSGQPTSLVVRRRGKEIGENRPVWVSNILYETKFLAM